MKRYLLLALLLSPTALSAQETLTGNWDVKSTAVDLEIPGTPGFLLRMMKGRSRIDHKCVSPEQAKGGIAALLQPDAKSKCRVEAFHADNGRFAQVLACPQKDGGTFRITSAGAFGASSYSGRMTMTGQSKGRPVRIIADQVATHTGPVCRK